MEPQMNAEDADGDVRPTPGNLLKNAKSNPRRLGRDTSPYPKPVCPDGRANRSGEPVVFRQAASPKGGVGCEKA